MFKPAILFVLLPLLLPAPAAQADEFRVGNVLVENPWSRPPPAVAVTAAAYFTLSIRGGVGDRLVAAASPAAKRVELHQHLMQDGVMSMRQVLSVDVQPGATTDFEPGGLHVMLMGLSEPLLKGATFPLTLTFEKAGRVVVTVKVEEPVTGHDGHGKHDSN